MQKRELDATGSSLHMSSQPDTYQASISLPIEGVIHAPHIIVHSTGGEAAGGASSELWTPLVMLCVRHSEPIRAGQNKSPRNDSRPAAGVDVCFYSEDDMQRIVRGSCGGSGSGGGGDVLRCIW
jgi:hypothetical protein